MDAEDALSLSALQHWAYCPRQCGLIHLEQTFEDNVYTLRGQADHKRVDRPGVETAKGVRTEHALPLWNDSLGLMGKADVVEFDRAGQPYPVEYKHGSRNKAADIAACDDVQLAAQALCLEAMFVCAVPEGAIYYASSKRRRVVPIDQALRDKVMQVADEVRQMLLSQTLPPPLVEAKATQRCRACSLRDRCQPEAGQPRVLQRAARSLFDPDADLGGQD